MLALLLQALSYPAGLNTTVSSGSWVLALQRCNGASTYTLHGLWPPTNDCGGPPFSEAAIKSIESQLSVYWASCPEYSQSNLEFWDHEWTKHGTCSGLDEKPFFSAALSLRNQYASKCAAANADACELSCSGAHGPCH